MRKTIFHISILLLTYTIGISFSLFSATSSSVDKRFTAALTKFYQQNAEKDRQRRQIPPQSYSTDIKILLDDKKAAKNFGLTQNEIKMLRTTVNNPPTQASEKSPEDVAREIRFSVASDVARTNQNCKEKNYSALACNQLKENAIKDIEGNMLNNLEQK